MGYKYKINKRKANRISYRILGAVFILIGGMQLATIIKGYANHMILTSLFILIVGMYGIYLFRMSFRKQAYSITYIADESGFTVEHHYGVSHYNYDEIEAVTMVIPDESMIFYILNVLTKKERYTISFMYNHELCENMYEYMHARLPKDDEEESTSGS